MAKNTISKGKPITHADVRLYRIGTGDCIVIKFFSGNADGLKMMIDCGVTNRPKDQVETYVKHLIDYVDSHVDVLVITHEHDDHVNIFHTCRNLFVDGFDVEEAGGKIRKVGGLTVGEVWMGWAEEDGDGKVETWKSDHGKKKMALAVASKQLQSIMEDPAYQAAVKSLRSGVKRFEAQQYFLGTLQGFVEVETGVLKADGAGQYVGLLKGMDMVKKTWALPGKTEYLKPGKIKENIWKAEGVKVYVLGPPMEWDEAKKGSTKPSEVYPKNLMVEGMDAFADAINAMEAKSSVALPFDLQFLLPASKLPNEGYDSPANAWRRIDHDWLQTAGSLALRLQAHNNNMSLALAIELPGRNRIMLFPGDAEYGSWKSWHDIQWETALPENEKKSLTATLLRNTVFYKVAHHMSSNGTARRLGLDMMVHGDLAAMATLDYDHIAKNWKSTMPNHEITHELLKKTKGRLMVTNENRLDIGAPDHPLPLKKAIAEAKLKMNEREQAEFDNKDFVVDHPLYWQYRVRA